MKDNKGKLENEYKDNKKRKIEFRAKGINCDKWYYGFFVQMLDIENRPTKNCIIENMSNVSYDHKVVQDFHFVELNTLGEFTGLCDKNGKKIYEGDICLCNRHIADSVDKRTFEIIFDGSWIGLSNEIYGSQIGYEEFDMCEVIGNVYDNPELLGGSDEECDN